MFSTPDILVPLHRLSSLKHGFYGLPGLCQVRDDVLVLRDLVDPHKAGFGIEADLQTVLRNGFSMSRSDAERIARISLTKAKRRWEAFVGAGQEAVPHGAMAAEYAWLCIFDAFLTEVEDAIGKFRFWSDLLPSLIDVRTRLDQIWAEVMREVRNRTLGADEMICRAQCATRERAVNGLLRVQALRPERVLRLVDTAVERVVDVVRRVRQTEPAASLRQLAWFAHAMLKDEILTATEHELSRRRPAVPRRSPPMRGRRPGRSVPVSHRCATDGCARCPSGPARLSA